MSDLVVVQSTSEIGWCRGAMWPKLAIVILLLAALLFLVAPNLSWANCSAGLQYRCDRFNLNKEIRIMAAH
jgi:hypothetical protein